MMTFMFIDKTKIFTNSYKFLAKKIFLSNIESRLEVHKDAKQLWSIVISKEFKS